MKSKKKVVPSFWVVEAGSIEELNHVALNAQVQGYRVESVHRHADAFFQNYEIVLRHGRMKKK